MCQVSKRYGRMVQAEIVHHVFPQEEFPEYELSDWNLISVTKKTHNTLHDRDTGELTVEGIELLRRIARKNNIEIPEKYTKDIKRAWKHENRNRYK